jgi:hypothetical protein
MQSISSIDRATQTDENESKVTQPNEESKVKQKDEEESKVTKATDVEGTPT